MRVGEVHEIERFYRAKIEDLGVKVKAESVLGFVVRMEAELVRQFQLRWGIAMEWADGQICPSTPADAEKLRTLKEAPDHRVMFDPRVTGDMEVRRT